ncbi:MAG: acyl--CoA ligase [Bauldia sp.]|nr:acyl--CoA ligase [Bauldia sp.]
MNLASRFVDLLGAQGRRIAIREPGGRTVTYDALRRQIIGLIADLKRRGFKRGDPAVIQAPNGIAFVAATVAVAALGGSSVMCEPGLGDDIYRARIAAAHPKWVIVHPIVAWANRIPGARRLLARREVFVPPLLPDTADLRRVMVSAKTLARIEAAPHEAAYVEDVAGTDDVSIIFTGGTTSSPKGVRLSHDAVVKAMANIAAIAVRNPGRTFIADTPQQTLYGLALGQEVLVTRGRIERRAAMVRGLIEANQADSYFGSPFLWMEMMQQAGAGRSRLPASLKAVFLGGAPVTPEFLRTLRDWLHPDTAVMAIYGMTEAAAVAIATAEEKLAWTGEGDFVGRLMPGVTATTDESGEIVIDSPSLFTGYTGQPDRPPGGGFATGDLGRVVDHNGAPALVLLGRAKDMIIRAGVNIYPATLEAGLRAVTGSDGRRLLRDAALVGLWDDRTQDEVVVLCWQPMADTIVDEAQLARRIETVTGGDARPDFLLKVDPMPVTGRQNKVDKVALRAMAAARFGLGQAPRHMNRA